MATTAALRGLQGLRAVVDDNVSIYVEDQTPQAERLYRARFYFDPNSISMVSNNSHYLFDAISGTTTPTLRIHFHRYNGQYRLRAMALTDGGSYRTTVYIAVSDQPHLLELAWAAATPGTSTGWFEFWIDNVQRARLTAIPNGAQRVDAVRMGAVSGVDSGTRGTYFFDEFESRRSTYIGPAAAAIGAALPGAMTSPSAGEGSFGEGEEIPALEELPAAVLPLDSAPGTRAIVATGSAHLAVSLPAAAPTGGSLRVSHATEYTLPPELTLLAGPFEVEQLTPEGSAASAAPLVYTVELQLLTPSALPVEMWLLDAQTLAWKPLPAARLDAQRLMVPLDRPALFALAAPVDGLPYRAFLPFVGQ